MLPGGIIPSMPGGMMIGWPSGDEYPYVPVALGPDMDAGPGITPGPGIGNCGWPPGPGGGPYWPNVSPAPIASAASDPRNPLRMFPTPVSADPWLCDPSGAAPDGVVWLLRP
jgi:hypothetical protein